MGSAPLVQDEEEEEEEEEEACVLRGAAMTSLVWLRLDGNPTR